VLGLTDPEGTAPGDVVKLLVHRIPAGRAASYGTIGRAAVAFGRPIGGARTVAWILASLKRGDDTPWHRVVGAGGVILLPDRRGALQRSRLRSEGVRFAKTTIEAACMIGEAELLLLPQGRRKGAENHGRSSATHPSDRAIHSRGLNVKKTRRAQAGGS
jgi:methylated-DNA-protein-cysteine methyltransferase related protein